ncbi:ABC transporter permease [Halolamina salifodinae]|uniref:Peptide/nickel transport system permease protein n=1 Tax=Halolamina salifodinae TaxID=1202767 RepID=A0A8T4GWD4_9EURY|nr:ABC transporter permease [Halolamina salifodinae]MBP1985645.1 peptide/nickel transport system permease protein [Halolamina salifodinae]
MAADKQTFDEVDWGQITGESDRELSPNFLILLAGTAMLLLIAAFDYFFVTGTYDAAIGMDFGNQYTPTFDIIGWGYDVTQLDWLFAFSLLLFGAYVVLPLYQNPRMSSYYWREMKRNRPAMVSLGWLIFIFVIGVLGPVVIAAPRADLAVQYQPPVLLSIDTVYPIRCVGPVINGACQGTLQYPLGTTGDGKDIFNIIVYGMQISMKIGFIATLIVVSIGTAVGTVAAYAGGLVDEVLMRYVDVQQSFPTFILYLLILYIWGASLFLFVVLFGLFAWEGTARYVRSNALAKTEEEYIKAVQLSGASTYRIVRAHIVPNTASSIITDITLLVPTFILAEAQFAFLGLGDSTIPSWGVLIAAGRSDLAFAPWITLAPGMFLFFTILAFNFLGDALLDALNPEAEAESE